MFVCRLRTPSCSHCEHVHVYLAYWRQTGNVVTRQTFDRAPRLTRPPIAQISRGGDVAAWRIHGSYSLSYVHCLLFFSYWCIDARLTLILKAIIVSCIIYSTPQNTSRKLNSTQPKQEEMRQKWDLQEGIVPCIIHLKPQHTSQVWITV